jgi:hypothetical protein
MKNISQEILNFFDERLAEIKQKQEEDLEILKRFIKGSELVKMSQSIDEKWKSVVEEHKKQKGPLKLIIVGEAPLTLNKYFYINQGTFLDSLREHWKLKKNNELPDEMLNKRILVLDIYKYPIPSEFYKKDRAKVLLDVEYLNDKINLLRENHLINGETHFVFRYKQLYEDRKLNTLEAFKGCNFIRSNEEIVSFNTGEKPQKLNTTVKEYLVKNCS